MAPDRPTYVVEPDRSITFEVGGRLWGLDFIEVTEGDEAYEPEARAYLTEIPNIQPTKGVVL